MFPPSSTVCERGFDAFAFGKPRNDAAKLKAGTRANRGASDADFGATVGNPTVGGSGGNSKELAELRFGDESLVAEACILILRHDFIFLVFITRRRLPPLVACSLAMPRANGSI